MFSPRSALCLRGQTLPGEPCSAALNPHCKRAIGPCPSGSCKPERQPFNCRLCAADSTPRTPTAGPAAIPGRDRRLATATRPAHSPATGRACPSPDFVIAVARRALPARCPPSASNTISGDVLIKEFLCRGGASRSACAPANLAYLALWVHRAGECCYQPGQPKTTYYRCLRRAGWRLLYASYSIIRRAHKLLLLLT